MKPVPDGVERPARVAALAALLLTLGLAGCGGGTGAASSPPAYASASTADVSLSRGWVSAVSGEMAGMAGMGASSMPGMDMSSGSAAYATLRNTEVRPDALVSVSTPAAGSATLHTTVTSANGSAGTMMRVRAIPVAAGASLTLAPGGYHVMLTDLRGDLRPGSSITMTWRFRSGATLTTSFPVISPSERPEEGQ